MSCPVSACPRINEELAPLANSKRLKVAFTGSAGHGKSTAAAWLVKKYGGVELSLAKKLKEMVSQLLHLSTEEQKYLYHPDFKNQVIPGYGVTGRSLLQKIGSELLRDGLQREVPDLKLIYPASIWVHNIAKQMLEYDKEIPLVVSDLRFPNEQTFLKDCGFLVIRIVRPLETNSMSDEAMKHQSEQGCDSDVTITNEGTLSDLYRKLDAVLKEHELVH